MLIRYEETEEHRQRQESVISGGKGGIGGEKGGVFLRKGIGEKGMGGLAGNEKEMDVKI